MCATASVGTKLQPYFRNQEDRFVFCGIIQAGNLQLMPEMEGRKHLRELKRQLSKSEARSK